MDIKSYLIPADIDVQDYEPYQWGNSVKRFTESGFPDLDEVKIAILGIGESRNSAGNDGCPDAPDCADDPIKFDEPKNLTLTFIAPLSGTSFCDPVASVVNPNRRR